MSSVVGVGPGGGNGPGGGHPGQMPHPMMMQQQQHERDMGPPIMHPHMGNPQGMPPSSQHHMMPQMGGPGPHPAHMHPQQMQMHRLPHFIGQPELRIYEMNKRLQQRGDDTDNLWWDSFASDFFEDDATITIIAFLEDGPKRYTIGRILIPRYFRSIYESGVGEMWFNLRITREAPHAPLLTLDSDCSQIMNMQRPPGLTVIVDGRFTLDFVMDDFRIRSWTFNIRSFREMVARPLLSYQDPAAFEHLSKNITRCGIPFNTMNFLRMSVILEPMQELMSRQKAYSLSPRDCLKTTLFQKWQRMMAPQGQPPVKQGANLAQNNPPAETKASNKRRKRKGSSANSDSSSTGGRATKRKQSPGPLPMPNVAQPGEVMIVGEPTLMGGDFGDEDERRITRLENTQFDPNQCGINGPNQPHPHMMPPMSMPHSNAGIPPHIAQQQQMMRASMAGSNGNGPNPFGHGSGPPPGMSPQQQQMFMQHHHQMMQQQHQQQQAENRLPMMHGPPTSNSGVIDNGPPQMMQHNPNFNNSPQMGPQQQLPHSQQSNTPSLLQQHFSGPNTPSSGHQNSFPAPHISQSGPGPDSFQPPRSSSANEMMKRNESNNNSPAISAGHMLMNSGGHRSNTNTPPPPGGNNGPPFHPGGNNPSMPSPLVNSGAGGGGGSRSIPSSPGMQNLPQLSSTQQNSNPHSVPPRNASRGDED